METDPPLTNAASELFAVRIDNVVLRLGLHQVHAEFAVHVTEQLLNGLCDFLADLSLWLCAAYSTVCLCLCSGLPRVYDMLLNFGTFISWCFLATSRTSPARNFLKRTVDFTLILTIKKKVK